MKLKNILCKLKLNTKHTNKEQNSNQYNATLKIANVHKPKYQKWQKFTINCFLILHKLKLNTNVYILIKNQLTTNTMQLQKFHRQYQMTNIEKFYIHK